MASTDHLHQEASVLPVRAHLSMLCSQFLLSALQPNHPSHPTVTAYSGPRNIRHTLQSCFRPSVSAHLINGITQPDSYRESLRRVHSDAVAAAIVALSPNRLLGVSPPAVSASERRLPRAHRTTLSQLRSGFSSAMRDYRHRIGAEPTPECPECADPCHSVPHLFSCPARPTNLSVGDMWERPLEVARFLLSVPSFSHLPELPPPPPEPPPPHVPGGGISNNNNNRGWGTTGFCSKLITFYPGHWRGNKGVLRWRHLGVVCGQSGLDPGKQRRGEEVCRLEASNGWERYEGNIIKAKIMVTGKGNEVIRSGRYPCGLSVGENSILCTICQFWFHKWCSGFSRLGANPNFQCLPALAWAIAEWKKMVMISTLTMRGGGVLLPGKLAGLWRKSITIKSSENESFNSIVEMEGDL